MKFKSMSPKGYLDCAEYRPGGGYYEWDNDSDGRYLSEMCDRCGFSSGDHFGIDTCPNASMMTPTPLRSRGRPSKVVSSSSDEEEVEKEEQTYYYGYSMVAYFDRESRWLQKHEIGWIPGVATFYTKDVRDHVTDFNEVPKRTADELFSDPTFELYTGPEPDDTWDEERENLIDNPPDCPECGKAMIHQDSGEYGIGHWVCRVKKHVGTNWPDGKEPEDDCAICVSKEKKKNTGPDEE